VTPWGTWITGEETTAAGHGYQFDVGAQQGDPTPLVDMGRFSHEACMVDPATGYVYETEDDGNSSGFYKFVPNAYGQLKKGGTLYMLRVVGESNFDFTTTGAVGSEWVVDWVEVDDPDAKLQSTFTQGFNNDGARFRRLEGCWWDQNLPHLSYFLSTTGGPSGEGQVFQYNPVAETLKLIYVSPGAAECENPDNLVVTPRGGLLLCEDNSGATTNDAERLLGLSLDGGVFTFAKNNVVLASAYNDVVPAGDFRQSEWAGACYSPNGQWLLVNIQTPGITFAITGPWSLGNL
jgi:secreted PhoX family phosphatase